MSPKGDFLLIIQDSAQVPCVTTILRWVRLPMLLCLSRRRADATSLLPTIGGLFNGPQRSSGSRRTFHKVPPVNWGMASSPVVPLDPAEFARFVGMM